MDFTKALGVTTGVFEQYRIDHPKWWKRMDGTPILNDVAVRMAAAFVEWTQAARPLQTQEPDSGEFIDVRKRLPARGQRIQGLSRSGAWIETFDPDEPLGNMTHWRAVDADANDSTEQPVSGAVDEREAFEKWIASAMPDLLPLARNFDDYQRVGTQMAWEAWQACAALSRAQQAPQESLKVIAAARTEIIKSIRAYGEKSCADYIEKWLQPDHIAVLIAAAKEQSQ